MKKIKPLPPDESNFVFTEGIDYLSEDKPSIWGEGDQKTLEVMSESKFRGKWLNLAAGDGRYNNILLDKAAEVVATDLDPSALEKLTLNTPQNLKNKLKTKVFNILESFPFGDNSFDGVFSTGTLHLFPESVLKKIFKEIDRVLKPDGEIFIDFATDIKRELPGGLMKAKQNETRYTLNGAKTLFRSLLPKYSLYIYESEVPQDFVKIGKIQYIFSCKYILVTGKKLQLKSQF